MTDGAPQGVHPRGQRPQNPGAAALMHKLRQAWTLHQGGRLSEAEPLYREVLRESPSNTDALHFFGLLECQRGNLAAGLASIERAIAAAPGNTGALYNHANILADSGKLAQAVAGYDRVVAMRPDHAGAWYNRGVALFHLQRHAEALESFDRALRLEPSHAEALFNRGNVLHEFARHEEALASYARVLTVRADHAGALFGRGNALVALKRLDEAIASYDRAMMLAPGNVSLLNNRAHALGLAGRHEEALKSLTQAIALDPGRPEMFNNLGNVHAHLKQFDQAADAYRRALALRPDYPEALSGLGYALTESKHHDGAIAAFERLLTLRPDYSYAPGMLIYAKMTACDWQGVDAIAARAIQGIRDGKPIATPIALFAVSDSPADHTECSRIIMADKHPDTANPLWRGEIYAHPRIRVAYISADFNAHAVATLMAGVFEHHDRSRYETIAISHGRDDASPMRARLMRAFDRFIDVRDKTDFEIASLLKQMEIDIAVDLTGLTGSGRPGILKFRSSGLQVQHLGFAGTMGAPYYDYILADRIVIPEKARDRFSEKIVYLPDAYLPNDNRRVKPGKPPSRADCGLPQSGFVFASFNNSYKFSAPVFDIWMRLLRTVEGSVLWLPESNRTARRNLEREAQARGVAHDRIVFAPYAAAEADHLGRLALAGLFLDTLPYNAHTTAADALWAGLPVLTSPGETFPARVAASLLSVMGLPELIAATLEDYEACALRLAREPDTLAAIREKLLRARDASPLFDTARFTRNLETAYAMMLERLRQGLPPGTIEVPGRRA
jgi:predicted O-linked N-acetylglucosamine transferase (SPINDLY family)